MRDHRLDRHLTTTNSLPRAIKPCRSLFRRFLLYSPDGRVKRRQRFALVEIGDIVLLLLWLIACTRRGETQDRGVPPKKIRRRLSTTVRRKRVDTRDWAMRALPWLTRASAGNEEALTNLVAKLPPEDHATASAVAAVMAAAAVLANATEGEEGGAPPSLLNEYASRVLSPSTRSRSAI